MAFLKYFSKKRVKLHPCTTFQGKGRKDESKIEHITAASLVITISS
jgi:hypothetical protein